MTEETDPRFYEKEERSLLRKMYDVQDSMLPLLDKGEEDPDYKSLGRMIERIEKYIQENNQTLI
jgi:hypothetical protein